MMKISFYIASLYYRLRYCPELPLYVIGSSKSDQTENTTRVTHETPSTNACELPSKSNEQTKEDDDRGDVRGTRVIYSD